MGIVAAERELYSDVFSTIEQYSDHSPGEKHVSMFLEMAKIDYPSYYTILDAGCGSGKGAIALRDAKFGTVYMCDITPDGLVPEARDIRFTQTALWNHLPSTIFPHAGKVDYSYCCDVLEHIPKEFTMLVLSRLLEVTRRGVFLTISLVPDSFGYLAGRPLHQTVESFVWWRDRLNTLGRVVEARDIMGYGVYLVSP